jgi:hypothetical protein
MSPPSTLATLTLTVLASVGFAFTTYIVASPYHRHLSDLLSLQTAAASRVQSQSIIRKNLQNRVKYLESIISGDLYKIKDFVSNSNKNTLKSAVGQENFWQQTNSSANIFLRASQPRFSSLHSLKKEHQELERWSESLNHQLHMQCLSIARQSAGGGDLADIVRRCEARIKRRAQRRLPSHKKDSGSARGTSVAAVPVSMPPGSHAPPASVDARINRSLQSTRRRTGRPSKTTFIQLKSYKQITVDQV